MTVRIEDLKVGMKVKLVSNDVRYRRLGGFVKPMEKYLGTVCTIRDIEDDRFRIEEDIKELGGWLWNLELIEKIVDDKEKKNKVYARFEEIEKTSTEEAFIELEKTYFHVVGSWFAFEKCIVNDNHVIGIFRNHKSTYKGGTRTYKGIAKCHPDDKFDLAKGLTIAMLRAYKNYLDRQIKSLY